MRSGAWKWNSNNFVTQAHIVIYVLAHIIDLKQWPGLQLSSLPGILLQFLQILDQVCVFISIMKCSEFCRMCMPLRSEAVRADVNFSQYHELQLMLMDSSFFLLSRTLYLSFLYDCLICGFEVWH